MADGLEEIFESDLAADAAGIYRGALAAGESVAAAVKRVRRELSDPFKDGADRRIIWIALAAVQSGTEDFSDDVRENALKALRWCEAATRSPEDIPFTLETLGRLRTRLGGEPPAPQSARTAKPVRPPGTAGDILAVSLPNQGGEAVLAVVGPSARNPSPDIGRIVWLFDLAPEEVTPETVQSALLAWRNYRQVWPNGLGRSVGCYDAKGPLPARRTRLLLRSVPLPPEFLGRMSGFGAFQKSADLPWVVEHDINDWSTAQWTVDPETEP